MGMDARNRTIIKVFLVIFSILAVTGCGILGQTFIRQKSDLKAEQQAEKVLETKVEEEKQKLSELEEKEEALNMKIKKVEEKAEQERQRQEEAQQLE